MLRFVATALFAPLFGCTSHMKVVAEESLLVSGFPDLPAYARVVLERLASCNHFAGETGANPAEREAEIAQALPELGCGRIEQDVSAIRSKYAHNANVSQALAAAEHL